MKEKLCECGCGQPTSIAKQTRRRYGHIKGQPVRFIRGHHIRVRPRGPRRPLGERFWKMVDRTSTPGGCWPWLGCLDKAGYGQIWVNGRPRLAHHVALELAGWIIPCWWLQGRHYVCDNPPCCRPSHLKIGTAQDDADDKVSKSRQARGERHGQAKLTETEVGKIRRFHQEGWTPKALAQPFGVSPRNICDIIKPPDLAAHRLTTNRRTPMGDTTGRTVKKLARLKLLTLFVVVLGLTGCATLTPSQRASLADYQQFANRVTQHYGKPDVQIMVGSSNAYGDGVSLMRPDGWMILSPSLLEPAPPGRSRDFGFAHELGHWVTGRFGCGPACEADAHAEAVRILVIGRPGVWTEQKAFNHSISFLCGTKSRQEAGRPVTKNHLPAAQEIADLAARYPQYPAKTC